MKVAEEVLIQARFGALSRGTESCVFQGRVPETEWTRMRCPFQEGDFPGPVKYGYISVGRVLDGPADLTERDVFCLYPHQTLYTVPASAVTPLPDGVPAERAVLAANMETAVNVIWDAAPVAGDTVTVVGGGVLGCLIAYLAKRVPDVAVSVVDPDALKETIYQSIGVDFCHPDKAQGGRDIVIHTSATEAGLRLCLTLARDEGRIVEASWYGDREVTLPLGQDFHSRRLQLIGSQVGMVSPAKRSTYSYADRMALALGYLTDPVLDTLFTHEIAFDDLPERLPEFAVNGSGVACVRIRYPDDT
ncbi:zinc-dependent alcohol dehydrogenase [Hwanghaeella grinnelliae]|uniref:zinc-dependent alcohol dehydrogenase n=1 Tax=Hwanghaeella grinnelliae TaxID=2500179 RepID=UPI001F028F58|nr:zinc-binding alcohol dehydrogenase [Hwanghaeella grinnelliae]